MKRVIILLIVFMAFCACKKDEYQHPSETEYEECTVLNIGYVTFQCTSDNPYYVYIDGSYCFTISGHSTKKDYHVSAGSHQFKVEQESGYLFYPTVKIFNLNVPVCAHRSISFP